MIRVNVTVPREILNSSAVVEGLKRTLRGKTAPDLRDLFEGTTEGWKNRPGFSQTFEFAPGHLSARVFASGKGADIYARVNAGSPPHTIRRKRSPTLRFQTGYRPSTSPRSLSSRAASRFGDVITPMVVHHPGFEAREFDTTLSERYQGIFEQDIAEAIDRAAR